MSDGLSAQARESAGALRSVFANPPLRRVQLAFAGSVLATYAYAIALAVFAYRHGGVTAVGVLAFVRLAIAAAVAPAAASLADRFRRERVMLASDLSRVATVGGAAAVIALHGPTLVVYALATATTVAGTVFRPAEAALLPTIARSPQELTAANVSSSTLDSVGSFLGPAFGALLLAVSGPAVVFGATAVAYAWSAALVSRIRSGRVDEAAEGETAPEGMLDGLLGGVRAVRHEPRLRLLIGLYGAQTLVAGSLGVLVVVTALRLLDLGASGVGLLEAASGVGSIIGAAAMLALVGWGRLGRDLGIGIVLWGAPLVLVGLAAHTAVAVAAWVLLGIGNTFVDISAVTLLQRIAPVAVAARVFGVVESVVVAGLALGALLAPVLVSLAGTRTALVVTGSLLPILAALTWSRLGQIDRGADVDDELIALLRRVPFLAPLPLRTLEFLAARLGSTELAPGETLFRAGDFGDRFYILRSGTLEIEISGGVKREDALSWVGEIALLKGVPRTATVRAATGCTLLALDREDFLASVSGHSRSRTLADNLAASRLGLSPS